MRKKIVAGNWKMNLTLDEARVLAKEIVSSNAKSSKVEIILSPSFVFLQELASIVSGLSGIYLSAQNCSEHKSGAYTGEVSASMLASIGVRYCIIGHSERRQYFQETNAILAKKIARLMENNIHPIFCCGEVLKERESGIHFDVIERQLNDGLFHLDTKNIEGCIIAYEPVWAIGTGLNATSGQAQEVHVFIRELLEKKYGRDVAESISILYGGSVSPANSMELFSCKDVDGGLVGGASLKATDFDKIINTMNSLA